jgi:hypothetical protein
MFKNKVTRFLDCRVLDAEHYDVYSLPNIIQVIETRRISECGRLG